MIVVPADYNAATPSGSLWMDFPASRRVLDEINARPGDWIWVSDTEVLVGAQLADDPTYGLVAVPHWRTLVHLDDYTQADFPKLWRELLEVLVQPGRSVDQEAKLFQLLTTFESIAPPNIVEMVKQARPGYFSFRKAGALHSLSELNLALVAIEDARRDRPNDPDFLFFYLETLRRVDPERAKREAEAHALSDDANAPGLAACINIWGAAADRLPDSQFAGVAETILAWVDRFERAPGRDRIRASILAQVQFNQGLILLRLGRQGEAQDALNLAHASDPVEPTIDKARKLRIFGDEARGLASQYREKPLAIAA